MITESAQSFVEGRTLAGGRAGQAEFARSDRLDAWLETWLAPDFSGWCLDGDLQRVHCQTIALHGDRDEYGSLEHAERIARLTSGPSRVVVLEGCGHVPHRERPARVLREVTHFLAHRDDVHFKDPLADSR